MGAEVLEGCFLQCIIGIKILWGCTDKIILIWPTAAEQFKKKNIFPLKMPILKFAFKHQCLDYVWPSFWMILNAGTLPKKGFFQKDMFNLRLRLFLGQQLLYLLSLWTFILTFKVYPRSNSFFSMQILECVEWPSPQLDYNWPKQQWWDGMKSCGWRDLV